MKQWNIWKYLVIVTCPNNIKRNLYSVSRQLDAFPPLPEHVEEVQLVVDQTNRGE